MTTDSSTTGTTGTTSRSREAQAYLDGVGAALADLPEDDLRDLLDELATHLDELAAEGEAPLASRIGSPEEYAAELRTAAGLPSAHARRRAGAEMLGSLRRDVQHARQTPFVVATLDFLAVLRPVWWVLRAWILVVVVGRATRPQSANDWSADLIVIPAGAFSFWILVVAVVASVQLGRFRGQLEPSVARRMSIGVALLNIGAALALLPVLASLGDASKEYASLEYLTAVPGNGVYSAGHQVTNLFPYDAAGNQLTDVRLYDQSGQAVDVGATQESRETVVDVSGQAVPNAYPYRYFGPSLSGVDPDAAGTPLASVAPLLGVPTPSPTPSPTSTPSASATKR